MKEAFLAGMLAMGANADDSDINIKKFVMPVEVQQAGESHTANVTSYQYGVTANDTRADTGPSVVRHIRAAN